MPRTEEENQRIREAQRIKILDAAKAVFARKGWTATMTDIANEAKVSQGLAYRYFANKEAIYNELMSQVLKSQSVKFQKFLKVEGTPTQRMESLITALLQSRRDSIVNFQVAVQVANTKVQSENDLETMREIFQNPNQNSGDPDAKNLRELMATRLQEMRDAIEKLIKEGQETGEFAKDDPAKLTLMVLSIIQNLSGFAMHNPEEFKKYYPYTDVIMRMLKADFQPIDKKED